MPNLNRTKILEWPEQRMHYRWTSVAYSENAHCQLWDWHRIRMQYLSRLDSHFERFTFVSNDHFIFVAQFRIIFIDSWVVRFRYVIIISKINYGESCYNTKLDSYTTFFFYLTSQCKWTSATLFRYISFRCLYKLLYFRSKFIL